jgi:hypothetical protein
MTDKNEVNKEGHTREWQDRARVVLDAKEAAQTEASPKQSPDTSEGDIEDVEEKSTQLNKTNKTDPSY